MTKLSVTLTPRQRSIGWCWFAFYLLALPSVLYLLPFTNLTQNLIGFLLNFLAVIGIFWRFLLENARRIPAHPGRFAAVCVGVFFANQIITLVLSSVILELFPDFSNLNNANIGQMASENYWLMFVSTVVLVPVSEEMLFRGLIFGSLLPKSRIGAYGVSALVFAAPHVVSYLGQVSATVSFVSLIQYLPAGLLLAFAYEKTDSLWASVFIHSAVNAIAMMAVR